MTDTPKRSAFDVAREALLARYGTLNPTRLRALGADEVEVGAAIRISERDSGQPLARQERLVLACPPTNVNELLADQGVPPYVPTVDHTLTQCADCGTDMWIGPNQRAQAAQAPTATLVLCMTCAVTEIDRRGRQPSGTSAAAPADPDSRRSDYGPTHVPPDCRIRQDRTLLPRLAPMACLPHPLPLPGLPPLVGLTRRVLLDPVPPVRPTVRRPRVEKNQRPALIRPRPHATTRKPDRMADPHRHLPSVHPRRPRHPLTAVTGDSDEARCWWCQIEPDNMFTVVAFAGNPAGHLFVWPPGDHDHAVTPPTPERLEESGHVTYRRIMEML